MKWKRGKDGSYSANGESGRKYQIFLECPNMWGWMLHVDGVNIKPPHVKLKDAKAAAERLEREAKQ